MYASSVLIPFLKLGIRALEIVESMPLSYRKKT